MAKTTVLERLLGGSKTPPPQDDQEDTPKSKKSPPQKIPKSVNPLDFMSSIKDNGKPKSSPFEYTFDDKDIKEKLQKLDFTQGLNLIDDNGDVDMKAFNGVLQRVALYGVQTGVQQAQSIVESYDTHNQEVIDERITGFGDNLSLKGKTFSKNPAIDSAARTFRAKLKEDAPEGTSEEDLDAGTMEYVQHFTEQLQEDEDLIPSNRKTEEEDLQFVDTTDWGEELGLSPESEDNPDEDDLEGDD